MKMAMDAMDKRNNYKVDTVIDGMSGIIGFDLV